MTEDSWIELWKSVRPDAPHPDAGALGEYGLMLCWLGAAAARVEFPDVAAHLGTDCPRCSDDLREIVAFAEARRELSGGSW